MKLIKTKEKKDEKAYFIAHRAVSLYINKKFT